MRALLLSIKPEYVYKILQGTKKYEFRKRLARKEVNTIYIYGTAPIAKVVASVQVEECLSASPSALWEITKTKAGINRAKYREYFRGCKTAYAYKLGIVNVFDSEKRLSDFGISTAPQSFAYIEI